MREHPINTDVMFAKASASRRIAVLLLAVAVLAQAFVGIAAGEIPHENFELVGSDLEMIVDLLSSSINFTERSLVALYYERISEAQQNLSIVMGLIGPAEQLLSEIVGVAESYENLSRLIPPFMALADKESSFVGMESSLMGARDVIRSLSGRPVLTPEETVLAIDTINHATSLIVVMNETIDSMLVHAHEISALVVENETVFADNDLAELIERLRDLLYMVDIELADFLSGGSSGTGENPWSEVEPFLTLWVLETDLYLGETLRGGGYLFFNGSFRPGYVVSVGLDDVELLNITTGSYGRYTFSWTVPVNESWLGNHQLMSLSSLYFGNLTSNAIAIQISPVPTYMTMSVSQTLLSPDDTLVVSVSLMDVMGGPVPGGSCLFMLDDGTEPFVTDSAGSYEWRLSAGSLGFGSHTVQAEYVASLPYASSSSRVASFSISIPTKLTLRLFADRLAMGFYLVGNGTLQANVSDPMEGMNVTILIDGVLVMNVTTRDRGEFSFTIETENVTVGSHLLRAEFLEGGDVWRYATNETHFTLYSMKRTLKYPFWPIIPGWGGVGRPAENAFDIFFGEYAYFTWLVIVIVIVALVKTIQLRAYLVSKRREAKMRAAAVLTPVSTSVQAVAEGDFALAGFMPEREPPSDPNGRIVWEYNDLIRFMARKRKVAVRGSMTHWEIARLLRAIGYPFGLVERVTALFEMAFYSGTRMGPADMDVMRDSSDQLRKLEKVGEGAAA